MEKLSHLCVTKELLCPADLWAVRWLNEGDLEAICQWFYRMGDKNGMSLKEWRQLHDEGYSYCGILLDGRLCSIAGLWKRASDVWEVIAVRTDEAYQHKEMGKCVVSFVAEYVLQHVNIASYTSRENNIGSIHTAQSVGFKYCTNIVDNEKWCAIEPRHSIENMNCPLMSLYSLQSIDDCTLVCRG